LVTLKVTLKEVAREAGVSLATASYALNGKSEVGEGTRAHVLEVAHRLGYQANLSARAMKTGRTGAIGLIIPNITNPLFARLAQSVTSAAEDHGAAVLLVDSEGSKEAEFEAIERLGQHGADGLIWFPVNDEGRMRAGAFDKPIVVLDRNLPGFDQVHAEYAEGGRLAGEHLVALGHRRIGLLNGPGDVLNSRQRAEGVRAAVVHSAEIIWSLEHPYVPELGAQALDLLARKEVTAIACGNDLIALGAMAALRDLGLAPGKDVSVIGFDDIELCRLVWPRLSSVRLPIAEMGAAAVERLMSRIKKPDMAHQKVLLGVSLSARESTAPVAPKTRRPTMT
jgi:LacI family transcriptional regulator